MCRMWLEVSLVFDIIFLRKLVTKFLHSRNLLPRFCENVKFYFMRKKEFSSCVHEQKFIKSITHTFPPHFVRKQSYYYCFLPTCNILVGCERPEHVKIWVYFSNKLQVAQIYWSEKSRNFFEKNCHPKWVCYRLKLYHLMIVSSNLLIMWKLIKNFQIIYILFC